MGLETSTYISGLNASWPLAGDPKSQGDDHLRLIKGVLQATFPSATKPFYIPTSEAFSSTIVLDATDQNNFVTVDCSAADVSCTLPSLTSGDKGWSCEIVKSNTGTGALNGVMVFPASGTIVSRVGATASIRIEVPFEPVKFTWTGVQWIAMKPGTLIGSSVNWDGANVPSGYRVADGTTYSSTTFAELNASGVSLTLRDKRGRVEAGVDNGSVGRLTGGFFGGSSVGSTGGFESNSLTLAQMPNHDHGSSTSGQSANHHHSGVVVSGSAASTGGGGFPAVGTLTSGLSGIEDTTHVHSITSSGSSTAHANVQPTIITQKLIKVA